MEASQISVTVNSGIPVFSFQGNCKYEGMSDLTEQLQAHFDKGIIKFVFDFSQCKLLNSPAMGELLDAILLVDRDFEGHVVVCGLDSLKETLFTISGIIPIAQETKTLEEALKMLNELAE